MKKRYLFIVSVLMFMMTSCEKVIGEGPVVTENRNHSNYIGVDLRCSAEVQFYQSNEFKVEVSAQQNILDILITEVYNNRLVIRFKNDTRVKSHEPIRVKVSAPEGKSFRISGSGNILAQTPLNPASLDLDISGSGNIELGQVTTTSIDANISGSGNMRITSGTAETERLRISGSGNINFAGVVAQNVTTNTSGSGETRVHAVNNLNVTISGSGSVYYLGSPTVNVSISGSGNVRKL